MTGRSTNLSVGQRNSIVELIRGGNSHGQVASILRIPKTTVYNVIKRYDSRGSTENAKTSGRRKSLDDRHGRKNKKNITVCKKQCKGLFEARGIVGAYAGRKYEFVR